MDLPALNTTLAQIRRALVALGSTSTGLAAVDRSLLDLDALIFHLGPPPAKPIVALLGGTGTGKSTISNRLLRANEVELTASNFRRTFTAGPVAIARDELPAGWLALPHVIAEALPARGEAGRVIVVRPAAAPLLDSIVLIDTPDVDGDQPSHHALADRVFRWANVVVFVVSPEKYQMPELLPYFRLASRYAMRVRFVMNKVEDRAVLEDFTKQLIAGGVASPSVFVQPRDDSTFAAQTGESLDDLRDALAQSEPASPADRDRGLSRRALDLAARVADQVVEPLRALRTKADDATIALRELRTREAGVDVDPMTRQLRKRMQQRSILYLMGPQRMLERVRAAPAALARLPRSTMALLRGKPDDANGDESAHSKLELPDFATIVADQFAVAQATIADVLRARCPNCLGDDWRIDPAQARQIVDGETDDLRRWLEARWNSNPRDTSMIMKVVQKLPGGQRLTKLSESAPYLVVLACGLNHFAFSGLDLLVIGGFSLATWIGEKISDEVAQRTRLTNRNIDRRFAALVRQQSDAAIAWLDARIPSAGSLDALRAHLDDLRELAGV